MNGHNAEKYLREAIDSVLDQTYTNWEIIFWDNLSTDGTRAIAESYADNRIRYFLSEQFTPLGEARELAMGKAKGEYLSFLDCDDLFLPEKLRSQVILMERGNSALCYGSALIINEYGTIKGKWRVPSREGMVFGDLLKKYDINMQTVMIKKSIMDDAYCFFDKKLEYSPDFNLYMKIASIYPIVSTDNFLSKYRIVSNSLSSISKSIAGKEGRYTLDYIFNKKPELLEQYKVGAENSYKRMIYYDAVFNIISDSYDRAASLLSQIKYNRWQYYVLLILVLIRAPKRFILYVIKQ